MKKIMIVGLAVMLATVVLFAENTVLTEQAVVDSAMKNNPALAAAEKNASAADAASHKAYWLPNPMIGVEFMGVAGSGVDLSSSMIKRLDISQAIPFPGKFLFSAFAAHDSSDAARWLYDMKKRETEKDARLAYYSLYKIIKNTEITGETVSLLKQVSKIAASRAASSQDSSKADLEYAKLQDDLNGLAEQKKIAISRLNRSAGTEVIKQDADFTLEPPAVPEMKKTFEEIKAVITDSAAAVKMAESEKSMAANMRNMEIAGYVPDVNITFKKQLDPNNSGYDLMLELEIPLWFFSNQQSDIARAGDNSDAAEKNYDAEKDRILYEAMEHFQTIKSDYRTLNLYSGVLIPQAEAAFRAAVASYQARKIEFMSMIDSERMALEMKQDYYMHLEEYLMHYRMLEELTGGI